MVKKLQIFGIIIFSWINLSAQEKQPSLLPDGFEVSYNDGIVLPHNETIDFLTKEYVTSFSVNALFNTNGEKLWQKIYHNPQIGFGLNFSTLGNKEVYGNAYSIYPFFEAPFLSTDFFNLNYRIAFGLSYITKTYDLYENYQNISLSTNPSIYFNLLFNADIKLTTKYHFFGAFGLTHFSNGKVRSPNLGINTITTSLGLRYMINQNSLTNRDFSIPELKNKNKVSVILSHGIKEHSRFINKTFLISSLNISYERQYSHWGQFGIGMDGFYDESLTIKLSGDPKTDDKEYEAYQLGAHLAHDFLVGDIALTVQFGQYLFKKNLYNTKYYNRIGLKYYSDNNFIINLSLKSHSANAEFIEFGFGYYLN